MVACDVGMAINGRRCCEMLFYVLSFLVPHTGTRWYCMCHPKHAHAMLLSYVFTICHVTCMALHL